MLDSTRAIRLTTMVILTSDLCIATDFPICGSPKQNLAEFADH